MQHRSRLRRTAAGVLAALAMVLGLAVPGQAIAASSDATTSQLQQDVNYLHSIGTTAVLAEVLDGTTAIRARGGVMERGSSTPVNWRSHFRIGSTTKTFVATVILQLVGEGRLSLDDSVEHWLPGKVTGHGNNGHHITVRQILQHTSGLFDYVSDDEITNTLLTPEAFYVNRFNTYTPDYLLSVALRHAPSFGAGTHWEYSNTNYIVAGMLVQAVTGRSWSEEVRGRIIVPLGLAETSDPGTNPNLPAPFPRGYQLFDATSKVYTDVTLHNMTWGGSAGALISTPHDVAVFFQALITGQLLAPAQLTAMKTTVPLGSEYDAYWPNGGYGLGIFVTDLPCYDANGNQRKYWHHGGDVIGYSDTNGVTDDGSRSAVVASATNTFMDPEFADGSIAGSERLVRNALCGANTGTTTGSARKKLTKNRLLV